MENQEVDKRNKRILEDVVGEDLLAQVKRDLQIDAKNVAVETVRIINCLQHYAERLSRARLRHKAVERKFDAVYSDVYKNIWTGHPLKPKNKTDIEILVNQDKKYRVVKQMKDESLILIEYLDSTVNTFKSATYIFRNIVEEAKLLQGMT